MPYISIKTFPKDDETKRKAAEAVLEAIQKSMSAQPEWVTVSVEDVDPAEWDENVVQDDKPSEEPEAELPPEEEPEKED